MHTSSNHSGASDDARAQSSQMSGQVAAPVAAHLAQDLAQDLVQEVEASLSTRGARTGSVGTSSGATSGAGSSSGVESLDGLVDDFVDEMDDIVEEMATVIHRAPGAAIVPTALTLGNAAAGAVACWLCLSVVVHGGDSVLLIKSVCVLLAVGMFCDAFDGYAARRLNVVTRYGAKLDSLADMIGFGIAPALLAWAVDDWVTGFVAAGYALAALWRLARFTAKPPTEGKSSWRWFRGLPTPGAALFVIVGAFFGFAGWAALIAAVLMVTPVPCPHAGRLLLGTGKSEQSDM